MTIYSSYVSVWFTVFIFEVGYHFSNIINRINEVTYNNYFLSSKVSSESIFGSRLLDGYNLVVFIFVNKLSKK